MGLSKVDFLYARNLLGKWLFILPFLFGVLHSAPSSYESNRVLFLINQGDIPAALDLYDEIVKQRGKHQFELLQQMSLLLLDQGFKSDEPEVQLMAIFGAGIAMNDQAFYLLEEGLRSPFPQIQVIALNFLGRTQQDRACELINRMMASPYPIIRLEAGYQLALLKHPKATLQIEALMAKMPPAVMPLFAKLFAIVGDHDALKILKKMLTNPDPEVRIAAIISASELGRDDLLPPIRKLAAQHEARQQEAVAYALGTFKDQQSIEALKKLSMSPHATVKLAALHALYELGEKENVEQMVNLAKNGDLFAIRVLGNVEESKDTLAALSKSEKLPYRLNASLSLLQMKDSRCLPGIAEILVRDMRDLAFTEVTSSGKALTAWKAIPSASHHGEESSILLELSLAFREEVLRQSLELPEKDFLQLAALLFATKQNDLIPLLTTLLINLDTPNAVQLLKQQQQKAGAPLIRNYATLALVKLKEDGPYLDTLKQWVESQQVLDIMKFRTFVPFDLRETPTAFELTPQETARLLVEALEILLESDENQGIDILLKVLRNGHPRNRFVIAGSILHVAQ